MSEIDQSMDMYPQMMLDGNALAGRLQTIFGVEMTATSIICAQCRGTSVMGELRAFTQSPGIVLLCPTCEGRCFGWCRLPGRRSLMRGASCI